MPIVLHLCPTSLIPKNPFPMLKMFDFVLWVTYLTVFICVTMGLELFSET